MSQEQDQSQKTEQPTQKKIDESVKKGHIAYSREVTNFIFITFFAIYLLQILPGLLSNFVTTLGEVITNSPIYGRDLSEHDIKDILYDKLFRIIFLILAPLIICILSSFLGSTVQNGFIYSPEAPTFKPERISLISGIKRLFSQKNLVEFIKGILKILLLATIAYIAIKDELIKIDTLYDYELQTAMLLLALMCSKMMIAICTALAAIAAIDWVYCKYAYNQDLMMTKEEVKEELKQSEGDPEVKAKIRAERAARARRRIAAVIPKADVIITNPTHYSIALEYKPDTMPAPKVLAKGRDNIALKIREIAAEHNIPRVENPKVAQALYRDSEEGEYIKESYYSAVAEIMSTLKKFKRKS